MEGVARRGKSLLRHRIDKPFPERHGTLPHRRNLVNLTDEKPGGLTVAITSKLRLLLPRLQAVGHGTEEAFEAAIVATGFHAISPIITTRCSKAVPLSALHSFSSPVTIRPLKETAKAR